MPETLHKAILAAREYYEGIDRADVLRKAFAFWLVFTVMFSVMGPAISTAALVQSGETITEAFDDYTNTTELTASNWSIRNTASSVYTVEIDGTENNSPPNSLHVFGDPDDTGGGGDVEVDTQDEVNLQGDRVVIQWDQKTELDNAGTAHAGIELDNGSGGTINAHLRSTDNDANDGWWLTGSLLEDAVNDTSGTIIKTEGWTNMTLVLDFSVNNASLYKNGTRILRTNITANPDQVTYRWDWSQKNQNGGRDVNHVWWDDLNFDGGVLVGNHTVSGTVKDGDGNPIEDATVTVNDSAIQDTTGADGQYSVDLDNGTYTLTAEDTEGNTGDIEVTVDGADLNNQNITVSDEELSLDVPTHMFPNETAAYEVTLEGTDVTDQATVTSSDPTNLTVNEATNELEATSDTSFAGEITITAEHDGLTASRNVTVANLSASNVALMQNAADMTAAIWGDVQGPDGTRPGGTQLTMRVLFVALLIGAAIATHASGFAGIGGITLIVVMGWFMGWVSDGMALVTVFTGLFIGLNLAANIDYSVRK